MSLKTFFTLKRMILVGAGFLLVIFLGLFFLFMNAGKIITSAINTFGPKFTKVETHVSAVYLSPWSGAGSIRNLFLGNPSGYQTSSAVEVGRISISIEPASLAKDVFVIKELLIKSPKVTWEGSLSESNLSRIQKNLGSAGGGSSKSSRKILIRHLRIEGAELNVKFVGLKEKEVEIPDIKMENVGGTGEQISSQILGQLIEKSTSLVKQIPELLGRGVEDVVKGVKGLFK